MVAAFLGQPGLPFASVLSAERVARVFAKQHNLFAMRGVYSTVNVLCAFLGQVLRDGKEAACQAAVAAITVQRLTMLGQQLQDQFVPLSSKTDKLYPCEARVTVEGRESKAMADQFMTVSKERLTDRVGSLSPHELHGVDMAIRIQLGLAA